MDIDLDIPEELYELIVERAAAQGLTVEQYFQALIIEELKNPRSHGSMPEVARSPQWLQEYIISTLVKDIREDPTPRSPEQVEKRLRELLGD